MQKIYKFITALFFMVVVLSITAIPTFALTDGDWEFQLLDNEVMITGYLGNDINIVVPEKIFGATVTKIDVSKDSQKDFSNAKSITLPNGIKKVGSLFNQVTVSFENYTLESIVIPEGVEEIDEHTFKGCFSLKSIALPSTIKTIGKNAFYKSGIEVVNFPYKLEKIGQDAFAETSLKNVDLSKCVNLRAVSSWAFSKCKDLETVKFPQGLEQIGDFAFNECDKLSSIDFSDTITSIGLAAFSDCISLKSVILPTSLKLLDGSSFNNTALKEVVIPYGTTTIEHDFQDCPNLQSLYIPDTVTSLSSAVIWDSPNCIIYCTANSKAAEICKKNNISYLTDNSVNSGITVLYNGTRVSFHSYDQNPELINSRTLVPLRSIFEAMGADVEWVGETSTVIATRNGVKITLQIGSNTVIKNNENITIDTPPMLLNSRTNMNTTSCGCLKTERLLHISRFVEGTSLTKMLNDNPVSKRATSGYTGVTAKRGKWQAVIQYKKVKYYLGCYSTIEEAAKARANAMERIMEDVKRLYEETDFLYQDEPKRPPRPEKEKTKKSVGASSRAMRDDNTSGCTGVTMQYGKWNVSISYKGYRYRLGAYDKKQDAVKVRKQAEKYLAAGQLDKLRDISTNQRKTVV